MDIFGLFMKRANARTNDDNNNNVIYGKTNAMRCVFLVCIAIVQEPERAIREAFLSLDEKFLALAGERDWYSGSTVLVALMRGR